MQLTERMNLTEIIEKLENLKSKIWVFVEEEQTELDKQIKDTTNLLLDLLEERNS